MSRLEGLWSRARIRLDKDTGVPPRGADKRFLNDA
jgi:hypothetical protein